jgi:micrococcal nuclease
LAPALIVLILTLVVLPIEARAQIPTAATVTRVIDGDTVEATLSTGAVVTVRLIGIDTPETKLPGTPVECGGPEASEAMRQLVEGRAVTLAPDPTQDTVDRYGRSLFYVDRNDGLDVGLQMIRRGWAETYVYGGVAFQRYDTYLEAEDNATGGVWRLCDEDFHRDQSTFQGESAKDFVRLYYRRLSNDQYLSAWRMLGAHRKAQVRPYSRWKSGYKGSLGVSIRSVRARLAGSRRAVVTVRLLSRDRDVCSHKTVRQRFYGNVILAPHRDSWLIIKFQIRKTGGSTPRLSKSDCPVEHGGGGGGGDDGDQGGGGCDPSYPDVCIAPYPPDLDCDDIPYQDFRVIGNDPHGFDGNDDHVGCES